MIEAAYCVVECVCPRSTAVFSLFVLAIIFLALLRCQGHQLTLFLEHTKMFSLLESFYCVIATCNRSLFPKASMTIISFEACDTSPDLA